MHQALTDLSLKGTVGLFLLMPKKKCKQRGQSGHQWSWWSSFRSTPFGSSASSWMLFWGLWKPTTMFGRSSGSKARVCLGLPRWRQTARVTCGFLGRRKIPRIYREDGTSPSNNPVNPVILFYSTPSTNLQYSRRELRSIVQQKQEGRAFLQYSTWPSTKQFATQNFVQPRYSTILASLKER